MSTENLRRPSFSHVITLGIGLAVGLGFASSRPPMLHAGGGDRWDESIVASGPATIRYNDAAKVQVAHDALFYLDYRAGKLLATIPSFRQTGTASRVINDFTERDLVADFKLDVETGPRPHFLMTTGSIPTGSMSPYGEGGATLFVFESTTRQVAAYKISQLNKGTVTQTSLELLEVRPFGKTTPVR